MARQRSVGCRLRDEALEQALQLAGLARPERFLDAVVVGIDSFLEPGHYLGGMTPLARYQRDLPRIRSLGAKAAQLDALFHHRVARSVKKDGTVSYLGRRFEVTYELSGKAVRLVVDPHAQRVVGVEDEAGVSLGAATELD